jgi:oxaloacetate decarboxylase beta subunit
MDTWHKLVGQVGLLQFTWQNGVMFLVGATLIYLAIRKSFEPLLLIPIGFRAIVANLPLAMLSSSSAAQPGEHVALLQLIYDAGIRTELLPPVIFLGVGALTDFRPLLGRPITFLLGAVAVAAYSYMAPVPVVQPPVMNLCPTQEEREIDMPQARPPVESESFTYCDAVSRRTGRCGCSSN